MVIAPPPPLHQALTPFSKNTASVYFCHATL